MADPQLISREFHERASHPAMGAWQTHGWVWRLEGATSCLRRAAPDFAQHDRELLGLHGIESQIQRVTIDDKTYHRVRIGPTSDLDELNMLRSRLRSAQIDVLRIRLGD